MNKAPEFSEFWRAYPRKRGKDEAERAWRRMTAGEKRKALAALPAYIADCQQGNVAFKYPQGWLNGKRWKDYEEDAGEPLPPVQGLRFKVQGADNHEPCTLNPEPGEALQGMDTW